MFLGGDLRRYEWNDNALEPGIQIRVFFFSNLRVILHLSTKEGIPLRYKRQLISDW